MVPALPRREMMQDNSALVVMYVRNAGTGPAYGLMERPASERRQRENCTASLWAGLALKVKILDAVAIEDRVGESVEAERGRLCGLDEGAGLVHCDWGHSRVRKSDKELKHRPTQAARFKPQRDRESVRDGQSLVVAARMSNAVGPRPE